MILKLYLGDERSFDVECVLDAHPYLTGRPLTQDDADEILMDIWDRGMDDYYAELEASLEEMEEHKFDFENIDEARQLSLFGDEVVFTVC